MMLHAPVVMDRSVCVCLMILVVTAADPVLPDTVTKDLVLPDTVKTDPVPPDTVTAYPVLPDTVTADPVLPDTVTADPVLTDTVTADPVLPDTVTADPVLPDTADPVFPDTVTADLVPTNTVAGSCGERGSSCDQAPHHQLYNKAARCPEIADLAPVLRSEPQMWQDVTDREVWVFSAYVERRKLADGPAVRVIAAGLQEQFVAVGELYCVLWYEINGETIVVHHKARYIRIYPSTMHADMWVSHFILCPIREYDVNSVTPYSVSITPRPCDRPANFLLVQNRLNQVKTPTHALCLPPIYMKFANWQMVIEIIEIHRQLGASEVTVYNKSMSGTVSDVLHSYAKDPSLKVNVIQWQFPDHVKSNVNCQRGAINDCVYRMSSRHQYVTVSDLDEVLMPREVRTWPQLMTTIATPTRGIYMFQHAYFRRNRTGETPYLITQQSLWRTHKATPEGKIRCKSMYNTDLILSSDLHFHFALLPESEEYMLPPSVGLLHHYRMSPMETFRRNPEKFTYIEDKYMLYYGEELVKNFNEISMRINL